MHEKVAVGHELTESPADFEYARIETTTPARSWHQTAGFCRRPAAAG
jgi:hypothetical protein